MKLRDIPFRFLSFLFILYSNSSYAPIGKNAGFYCDDSSIKESYHGDSISAPFLFLTLLGGSALLIYLSENLVTNRLKDAAFSQKSQFKQHVKYYFSGFLYTLTATELLKFSCGELRPHFFYTCQPDMSNIKCSEGLIKNFNCTGSGPEWLVNRDIYKSFPSGHASLSFYAFIYLSFYIESRTKYVPSTTTCLLWKRGISLLAFLWSITCCTSRLIDHRHFWWDILVGVIIGLIGGLIMVSVSLKNEAERIQIKDDSDNNNEIKD